MTTEQIFEVFNPLLEVGLVRLRNFKGAESRDVQKIFGPTFDAISRAAEVDPVLAAEHIGSMDPSTVTLDSLHSVVRTITTPTLDITAARAKTMALIAELEAQPLTERDRVLIERKKPLVERSRQSIVDEMYELSRGKSRDGKVTRRFRFGYGDQCYDRLTQEIDRRDCEAEGIEYEPPAQQRNSLDYLMPMRG